jgi:predicted RNA-binding protein
VVYPMYCPRGRFERLSFASDSAPPLQRAASQAHSPRRPPAVRLWAGSAAETRRIPTAIGAVRSKRRLASNMAQRQRRTPASDRKKVFESPNIDPSFYALVAHLLQQFVDERASEHVEKTGSNPSMDA